VIDLHLHTTASDGLLSPEALVGRAAAAGLTVMSVTDHDTVAGLPEAATAAGRLGLRLVPGIELSAVEGTRDVHVLGYFFDPDSRVLADFLRAQRSDRIARVREIAKRLGELGHPIDVEALLARARESDRSIGRPAIADALIAQGVVADRTDAFSRLLGRDRPAFVPRRGAAIGDVIGVIHAAHGIASLAHPGLLERDDLIPTLAAGGLDALEVWHSDHSPDHEARYRALAAQYRLGRSGGSDYHGDGQHHRCRLGAVALPADEFARLESRARER
jgi:predicted metal-dependent phosphoesterase TrpH